jgi:hypothetical protein
MKDNRTMLTQMHPNCKGCQWYSLPYSNKDKVEECGTCSGWKKNKNLGKKTLFNFLGEKENV